MMPSIRLSAVFVGLFCIVLGATAVHAADAFSVKVEGLQGDLKSNVEAQLASMGIGSITIEGRYRARVRSGVRTGLRALGYYDPQLKFSWGPKPAEGSRNPRELTVVVTPGDPVKVMGAELSLEGDAANDPDFAVLRKNLPKKGSVLNHGEYEDFKKSVQSLATRKGYFQGRFTKNELGVSRERREAYWRLAYDSGPRWHFGPVSFSGGQIDADMLEPLVPFKDGEPYAAPKLAQ